MKRKNAVLVYDLLLEMLDANTASSSSQTSSASPGSDTYSEQQQFPPPPSDLQPGLDQMATAADNTTVPPAEVPVLDGHLLTLQSTSPSQNLAGSHLDSNE